MTVTRKTRIGALDSIEDIRIAIRDLENAIGVLTDEVASTTDDAPVSPKVLVRLTDGTYELWDLVSTGGDTIVKNTVAKQFEIHVP